MYVVSGTPSFLALSDYVVARVAEEDFHGPE